MLKKEYIIPLFYHGITLLVEQKNH